MHQTLHVHLKSMCCRKEWLKPHVCEVTSAGFCQQTPISPYKGPGSCPHMRYLQIVCLPHSVDLYSGRFPLTLSTEMSPCFQAESTVSLVFPSAVTGCTSKVLFRYQSDFCKRRGIPWQCELQLLASQSRRKRPPLSQTLTLPLK